jgi:hypothetical protein
MKSIRHLITTLCLLAAAAAANADTSLNAAIVRFNVAGRHYLYAAEMIKPGDDIYLQTRDQEKVPACCVKRTWKTATLVAADPVAIDFGSAQKLYRYRLEDRSAPRDAKSFVGIGAFGKTISVKPAGNGAVRVRGGDNTQELALCTSPEGVHLVGQAGGKALSHLYLYLGVDIAHPTCPADIAK